MSKICTELSRSRAHELLQQLRARYTNIYFYIDDTYEDGKLDIEFDVFSDVYTVAEISSYIQGFCDGSKN